MELNEGIENSDKLEFPGGTIMWFWWFMYICNLLLPVIMVIAGRMMWKYPPKEINSIYGYRTKRSRINQDTWKFAHEYCGRLWWKMGVILLALTILFFIPFMRDSVETSCTGPFSRLPTRRNVSAST